MPTVIGQTADGGLPAHPCCRECLHEGGPFQGILALMGGGEVDG